MLRNTLALFEPNPPDRSGNFTGTVEAGGQDDALAEAASPHHQQQRKAGTYAHVRTHNKDVLIKGISTMCAAGRKEHRGKKNDNYKSRVIKGTLQNKRAFSSVCRLAATC